MVMPAVGPRMKGYELKYDCILYLRQPDNTTKDKPSSNINVALQYFFYLKLSSALVSILVRPGGAIVYVPNLM